MKKITLIFIIILLIACSEAPSTQQHPTEQTSLFKILFCPQDNCEREMIAYINQAKIVECAFFDLQLADLTNSIAKKEHKIIIHNTYEKHLPKNNIKNLNYKLSKGKKLMHNKFCILDNTVVITGSMNPTVRGNTKNNNNLLFIASPALAINYQAEFDEMWEGQYSGGPPVPYPKIIINNNKIENYFCPEDNCKTHILPLINNATSIRFMTFSFTDKDIANLLIRKRHTANIKGIHESSRTNMKYEQYQNMQKLGMNIKGDNTSATFHHKVFILDNKIVITGSYNPTSNGNTANDENVLIIHNKEIANQYLKEFDRLWNDLERLVHVG
jgi:phosphatidylserine/phosphatidylglycerophosphate/cardiolipin synthase-like enzyme